jgi:GNAT superfamily N-acetyltransferase
MSKNERSTFVKRDVWLSDMLGWPAFTVIVGDSFDNLHDEINAIATLHKQYFVQSKIRTDYMDCLHACERIGFRLVDTNVQLSVKSGLNIDHHDLASSTKSFRPAQDTDKQFIMDIAARNFSFDRFHQDRHIPVETAHRIKSEWVGNYFEGKRGNELIVAEISDKVVGFNLLLWNADTQTLTIDLIAVDDSARNQGIAKGLIVYAYHYVQAKSAEKTVINYAVGTQIANVPSLRLYQQCGFGVESSQYVLHLHGH